jgi:hypothetical protein
MFLRFPGVGLLRLSFVVRSWILSGPAGPTWAKLVRTHCALMLTLSLVRGWGPDLSQPGDLRLVVSPS